MIYPKRRKSGFALLLVVMGLLAASIIGSVFLYRSDSFFRSSGEQSEIRLLREIAISDFLGLQKALLAAVNYSIAAKETGGNLESMGDMSLVIEGLEEAGQTLSSFRNASLSGLPDFNNIPGKSDSFSIYPNTDGGRQLSFQILCLSSCNNNIGDYPKVFAVRVQRRSSNQALLAQVSANVSIVPLNLGNYSMLVTNETSPEVVFGAGSHAKVGVFFDQTGDDPVDGKIRFVNGPEQEIFMEKLLTNVPTANIIYGLEVNEGGRSEILPSGAVHLSEGVLSGMSPADEISGHISTLVDGAIQSEHGSEIASCIIDMGCSSADNCTMRLREFRDGGDLLGELHNGPVTPGSVFYTDSPQGCSVVPSATNSDAHSILYGDANFTVISRGRFTPSKSVRPHDDLSFSEKAETNQGAVSFVSTENSAIFLRGGFESLQGHNLDNVKSGSSPAPDHDQTSVVLELAAISLADGKSALEMDSTILEPRRGGANNSFGVMRLDGPLWGAKQMTTTLVNERTGETVGGFDRVVTSFNNRWLRSSSEAFQLPSSIDHELIVTSYSVTINDLHEALSQVNLRFEAPGGD